MRIDETTTGRFSVLIPTLQRSEHLPQVVDTCAGHPRVLEVLVINNAPDPLHWDSPKVRVLQQERNIFVNPAWNLGAREARGEYLAIVNDDVLFDAAAFDVVGKALSRGLFGVIGPDRSAFAEVSGTPRVTLARASTTSFGFGVFMCLRRRDYSPIPESMRIWGGDDWLIMAQRRPPGAILGVRFETEMGSTTQTPEIQKLRAEEQAEADRILTPLEGTRWWEHLVRAVEGVRLARHRLRQHLPR
ncbi:glycosyltransferase family 2 protein [Granulicoccus phenolivorans]|uniref:glycosyltransferase family 2 protein n=1 Tax=Granulicoccus phenolivorans TaxID=266854 RepID=UPI00138AECF0|nr:glycosyltransferase family 2 protein [Granulicoccus phenolivorans]